MAKADDGRAIKDEERKDGQLVASQTAVLARRRTKPKRSLRSWLTGSILRYAAEMTTGPVRSVQHANCRQVDSVVYHHHCRVPMSF